MRHLFTDLQCERSKSRWREPGVIPVIHKLLLQCIPRVSVATAYWSSSLSNVKTLDDKKDMGPQFSTSSIVTSDHTSSTTKLYDSNWKLPSTTKLVRSRVRGCQGSHWHHFVPQAALLPALPREGRGPGQAAVSPTCPCPSFPAYLCVGELSAASCTM